MSNRRRLDHGSDNEEHTRDDALLILSDDSDSSRSTSANDRSKRRSTNSSLYKNKVVGNLNKSSFPQIGASAVPKLTGCSSSSTDVLDDHDQIRNRGGARSYRLPVSQREFDEVHGSQRPFSPPILSRQHFSNCSLTRLREFMRSLVPCVGVLQRYNIREDLLRDFIAGLTVCVMHIPQGMAYGMLAGLPPIYGLYSSIFPVLLYFIFGTSRHISVGTFAVVTLMVSVPVYRVADSFPPYQPNAITTDATPATASNVTEPLYNYYGTPMTRAQICVMAAIAVTLLTGIMQVTLASLNLGVLAIYLSQPLVNGFTTGAAFHVLTSQVIYIIGYSSERYTGPLKLFFIYADLLRNCAKFNSISFAIAVVCVTILLFCKELIQPLVSKRVNVPIPIDLAVIIMGTTISYALDLGGRYHVLTIGHIPAGFPSPQVPDVRLFGSVVKDCILIAAVSYAITISMAKIFAAKYSYNVSGNQELFALGVSNVFSSFFNCHANSASLSRSLVQDGAGCRTQVTSLFSCVGLTIVILFIAPLFQTVPDCVLASIILVALKGMFMQLKDLPKLWPTSKYDFFIWLVTFVSTVVIDVDYGLITGVVFSKWTLLYRSQVSHGCILGQVRNTSVFKDLETYSDAKEVDGVKVFRFDGPLHFASADHFRDSLFTKTLLRSNGSTLQSCGQHATNSTAVESQPCGVSISQAFIHHLVIDCSSINFVDMSGVKALSTVYEECARRGVTVFLAGPKWVVRDALRRMDFFKDRSPNIVFVSVSDAVTMALHDALDASAEDRQVDQCIT